MKKVAVILCNNMHMDIENANKLLTKIGELANSQIETDYTKADVVIIMTCAFGNGKLKSLRIISDVVQNMKKTAKLILTGCMVKTNPELLSSIKEDAEVIEFEKVLERYSGTSNYRTIKSFIPQNKVIISNGCRKKCSYCVYPNITGKYTSKPKEQVLAEIEKLYEAENTIYITGALETSDYGIDLYHKEEYNIAKLIEEICTKYPECNYIIGWFHPAGLTDEFIEVLEKCTNVTEIMVHIQHVSDYVLQKMNRPEFSFTDERIKKLKSIRPDIAISTEVIVGFPGETDEDFWNLVNYLDNGKFSDIGVANYEQVANTPAALLPQMHKHTKIQRMNLLLDRYDNVSSYPSSNVEESNLEAYYIQTKNKITNFDGMILNSKARQQYKFIAGTDTELKFNIDTTISKIYKAILNARDELEIDRVRKEVQKLYTDEFRRKLCTIFCNTIKKTAMLEKLKNILTG